MAYVCIVFNDTLESIDQLNSKLFMPANAATSGKDACALLDKYLSGVRSRTISATMQITTRDSDPSISTSGSDSKQTTFTDLK